MTKQPILTAGQRTLGRALASTAARRGPATAVEHDGRAYSFSELNSTSNRLANALSGLGLERGDRICALSENRLEYALVFYAAAKLGVAVSPLNWRLSAAELGAVIAGVAPRLALVSTRHRQLFAAATGSPAELTVVALDGQQDRGDIAFDDLIASGAPADPGAQVDAEDVLIITHTSGTTGFPKGAAISHRALIARAMGFAADQGWEERETFIAWSPLFHTGGVDGLLASGVIGSKCTVIDGMQPERIAETVLREHINWLFLPPGGIGQVIDVLRSVGRPRGVRLVGSMADLVPPDTIAETTELFGAPYFNSFGSTEGGCYPCATAFVPIGVVPRSLSKRQSAFCDVLLVDEEGDAVPNGEPGEMLLQGPMLFSGYLASGYAIENDFDGGWFHTGDVMVRNPDGTLDFVERKKYMIKSGGENIYPAEIERLLLRHPGVVEVAVVKKADARWGEVPVACVAVGDPQVDEAGLRAYLDRKLARYKIPKEFAFLPAGDFHRNITGKIIRSDLEALVAGPAPRQPASAGGDPA